MDRPAPGAHDVWEWADRWLDSTVNLRANTKLGYRSILRRYLRPAFGSYPLARIDVLAVRTWLAKLEADDIGQATRAKAYRLLARILGAAVEARYRALVLVAAFGGLRWGELVGLRRKRIDLERGTVTVTVQFLEVNGALSIGPSKSAAGRRTVTLPAVVVEALAEHLARWATRPPWRRCATRTSWPTGTPPSPGS